MKNDFMDEFFMVALAKKEFHFDWYLFFKSKNYDDNFILKELTTLNLNDVINDINLNLKIQLELNVEYNLKHYNANNYTYEQFAIKYIQVRYKFFKLTRGGMEMLEKARYDFVKEKGYFSF